MSVSDKKIVKRHDEFLVRRVAAHFGERSPARGFRQQAREVTQRVVYLDCLVRSMRDELFRALDAARSFEQAKAQVGVRQTPAMYFQEGTVGLVDLTDKRKEFMRLVRVCQSRVQLVQHAFILRQITGPGQKIQWRGGKPIAGKIMIDERKEESRIE